MSDKIFLRGFRSVEECVNHNADKIIKVIVSGAPNTRESELIEKARKKGIFIEKDTQSKKQQGPRSASCLSALLKDFVYAEFSHQLKIFKEQIESGERPVVIVLDGLQDPHNLGAIARTAAFMGVSAIVLPKDRSVSVTETVYRVSSGGLEHVPVARVGNLSNALEELKQCGFWIVGFTEHTDTSIQHLTPDFPVALIVGSEEKGMRNLTLQLCDYKVKLQGPSAFQTLNASVAAALGMAWATQFYSVVSKQK